MLYEILFISVCCLEITMAKNFYTAAVVDYAPEKGRTIQETYSKNIANYEKFTAEAKIQDADIIVFPEYGLTTLLTEDFQQYAFIIPKNTEIIENNNLQKLQSIARDNKIYLVVDVLEQDPLNKTAIYNSIIVFNRQGSIVEKYRKINLFNEDSLTRGNETVTFGTDFGVNFTVFICFDILFPNPSRKVLLETGVKDAIFSTAWFSTMPFYASLTVQHGYSLANKVNLIGSNYNDPQAGNGGSGIYLANGEISNFYINGTRGSKLLIGKVPKFNKKLTSCPENNNKIKETANISNYKVWRFFEADLYKFGNLNLTTSSKVVDEICDGKICCKFEIETNFTERGEVYKLLAFDGKTLLGTERRQVYFCAFVTCEDNNSTNCGITRKTSSRFSKISLNAEIKTKDTIFIYPATLTPDLIPAGKLKYCEDLTNHENAIVSLEGCDLDEINIFGIHAIVKDF